MGKEFKYEKIYTDKVISGRDAGRDIISTYEITSDIKLGEDDVKKLIENEMLGYNCQRAIEIFCKKKDYSTENINFEKKTLFNYYKEYLKNDEDGCKEIIVYKLITKLELDYEDINLLNINECKEEFKVVKYFEGTLSDNKLKGNIFCKNGNVKYKGEIKFYDWHGRRCYNSLYYFKGLEYEDEMYIKGTIKNGKPHGFRSYYKDNKLYSSCYITTLDYIEAIRFKNSINDKMIQGYKELLECKKINIKFFIDGKWSKEIKAEEVEIIKNNNRDIASFKGKIYRNSELEYEGEFLIKEICKNVEGYYPKEQIYIKHKEGTKYVNELFGKGIYRGVWEKNEFKSGIGYYSSYYYGNIINGKPASGECEILIDKYKFNGFFKPEYNEIYISSKNNFTIKGSLKYNELQDYHGLFEIELNNNKMIENLSLYCFEEVNGNIIPIHKYNTYNEKVYLKKITLIKNGKDMQESKIIIDGILNNNSFNGLCTCYDETNGNKKLEGNFSDSYLSGRATIYSNNAKIDGEFQEGCLNGKAKIGYYNNVVIDGEFINGILNGDAVIFVNQDVIIEGHFNDGKINGFGSISINKEVINNTFFISCLNNLNVRGVRNIDIKGNFENGYLQGNGLISYDNNIIINGEFKNGTLNGKGLIRVYDIEAIKDTFIKEYLSINGISNFEEVSIEGNFENGILDGKAIIYVNNQSIDIEFIDGYINIRDFNLNGTMIKGRFIDGALNGISSIYIDDSLVLSGNFKNGKLNDRGTIYNLILNSEVLNKTDIQFEDVFIIEAQFKDDCIDGETIFYDKKGKIILQKQINQTSYSKMKYVGKEWEEINREEDFPTGTRYWTEKVLTDKYVPIEIQGIKAYNIVIPTYKRIVEQNNFIINIPNVNYEYDYFIESSRKQMLLLLE